MSLSHSLKGLWSYAKKNTSGKQNSENNFLPIQCSYSPAEFYEKEVSKFLNKSKQQLYKAVVLILPKELNNSRYQGENWLLFFIREWKWWQEKAGKSRLGSELFFKIAFFKIVF